MRRINDVRLTLIATQELGRWRMRSQLDAEESGSLSLGFAVGRSLCESASVCLTDAWSILPQICFGHIDRVYPASAKRRRQHGHSSSCPWIRAENAVGCGRVMIALNANGARWA
jgi:hypothetical protein